MKTVPAVDGLRVGIMYGRNGRSIVWSAALVALLFTAAGSAWARESEEPQSGVPSSIRYLESVTFSADADSSAPGSGAMQTRSRSKRLAVSFNTLGRSFDLDLEPNDLFAPGAKNVWIDDAGKVEEEPSRVFYRGRLKGSRDSWVRMTVERGTIDGMIWTPDEVYFVEPASRFFAGAGAGEMIAYRLSDTESDWTPESCAVEDHSSRDRNHQPHGDERTYPLPGAGAGPPADGAGHQRT